MNYIDIKTTTCMLIMLCGCSSINAGLPENSEIANNILEISITPGKPGAATEAVTLSYSDNHCFLTATRKSEFSDQWEAKRDIPITECEEVFEWVDLQDFQTSDFALQSGKVFDFGVRRFLLQTNNKQFDKTWTKPLKDDQFFRATKQNLRSLMDKYLPTSSIFYF